MEADKVTPESGVAEPEEAQVSEAEEQEEAIQETEVVETDESDEVEDTTSQEDEVEEVEEETPTLYTIKVDGEEEQVTLDEALSGHMREKEISSENLTNSVMNVSRLRQIKAKTEQLQGRFKQGFSGT